MRRLLRGILLLLGSAITAAGSVMAGEYSPPGLYDVEHRVLANGLRVILKPRHGAHTVAFRVVVGVGQHDFACGWQETPHFLEHLLFTGTSRYTEAGLDELIEQHGGDWNAYTYSEDTVYTLDIYGKYALPGLDVLLSPAPPAKGKSDTRAWGVKAHVERLPEDRAPDPEAAFDWIGIYEMERARIQTLRAGNGE